MTAEPHRQDRYMTDYRFLSLYQDGSIYRIPTLIKLQADSYNDAIQTLCREYGFTLEETDPLGNYVWVLYTKDGSAVQYAVNARKDD